MCLCFKPNSTWLIGDWLTAVLIKIKKKKAQDQSILTCAVSTDVCRCLITDWLIVSCCWSPSSLSLIETDIDQLWLFPHWRRYGSLASSYLRQLRSDTAAGAAAAGEGVSVRRRMRPVLKTREPPSWSSPASVRYSSPIKTIDPRSLSVSWALSASADSLELRKVQSCLFFLRLVILKRNQVQNWEVSLGTQSRGAGRGCLLHRDTGSDSLPQRAARGRCSDSGEQRCVTEKSGVK